MIYGASVIIRRGDEVLLMKRVHNPYRGFWGLVGGGKDEDESFEECAKREAKEEVGLIVNNLQFVKTIYVNDELGEQCSKIFLSEDYEGNIVIDPTEVVAVGFFNKHNLPSNLVPYHKEVLQCGEE